MRALLLGGLVLGVLLAMGCGDGSGSASDEGPPLTKAEFVRKANAICVATLRKEYQGAALARQEKLRAGGKSEGEIRIELTSDVTLPTLEDEIERIRGLGIPSGDEEQVEAFLDVFQEVIDKAKEDPEAFIEAQVKFKHPFQEGEKLARAYGVTKCPQGSAIGSG